MLRILLLDCSSEIESRLKDQGFDVESGTVGFCTGVRRLPCQIYEKDIFIYNPNGASAQAIKNEQTIEDQTPEYSLKYLEARLRKGATILVFVNRLSRAVEDQRALYKWIPYMPDIDFTSDKAVGVNRLEDYTHSRWKFLASIVTKDNLALPVLQKLPPPRPQHCPYHYRDVSLFENGHGDDLGILILRDQGALIVLPKFRSNDDVIETFLHRVLPQLYEGNTRTTLIERFASPDERSARAELKELEHRENFIRDRQSATRAELATAARSKENAIKADETSKQILVYWDNAKRQEDAALFYLYKIVEAIENKLGGEAVAINTLGLGSEWKSVKKIANASYGDVRHAPKPGEVIKKWTDTEIKTCFENTEKIIMAYFASLFPSPPDPET